MPRTKPRYSQPTDLSGIVAREISPPPISDISVSRLIDDSLIVLYREVKNLLALSARGKLDPNDARDLRDNLKLLFELKNRENESLRGLTDEQLQQKVTEALQKEKKDGND
jgi:hypothetical protein